MAEGVREEFEKAMNSLFDDKIAPLLKDIDLVMKNRLEQADNIAEARLTQFDNTVKARLEQIDQVIQTAFDRFEKTTDRTIAQIKTDIIDHATAQLDHLRRNFRADVDHFFDRTEYLINTVDCKVEGMVEKIRMDMQTTGKELAQELKASLPSLPSFSLFSLIRRKQPSESIPSELVVCYQELGLTAPPESFEYSTIYELKKCKVLKTLTPATPIRRILNVYLDLKAWAARMACVQRGAGHHATLHYTWDWLEFGHRYDIWYLAQ